MSQKQVREKSNSTAFIVLNKKGEHCANVQFYYGGSSVLCDVWSRNEGESWLTLNHTGKAGGYGYDKAAAALSGAIIEGYKIANHCGNVEEKGEKAKARLFKAYKKAAALGITQDIEREFKRKAEKLGLHFANYCKNENTGFYEYQSIYPQSGLDRLRMLGFNVIQAI